MWTFQNGKYTFAKGNIVKVWHEGGKRLAQAQLQVKKPGDKEFREAEVYELPEGMPDPFTKFDRDPGYAARDRDVSVPRRPTWGVSEPQHAIRRWKHRKRPNHANLWRDWFSSRQEAAWQRQVVCPYCGAGVGEPCVARTHYYGKIDKMGFPVVKQSVAVYYHKPRQNRVHEYTSRIDWRMFPGWLYWSSHQTGEDPDALLTALADVRGLEWALDYTDRLGLQEQEA